VRAFLRARRPERAIVDIASLIKAAPYRGVGAVFASEGWAAERVRRVGAALTISAMRSRSFSTISQERPSSLRSAGICPATMYRLNLG
jgi:hypothetical protein